MDRTLVFIDGPSLFYSSRDLEMSVNYEEMRDWFHKSNLVSLRYYNMVPRGEKTSVVSLSHHLTRLDYTCVCPEVDFLTRDDGSKQYNISVRALITGDLNTVIRESTKVERVVLVSHDTNLGPYLNSLQLIGIKTALIGTRNTNPPRVPYSLLSLAGNFIELSECEFMDNLEKSKE